MDQKWLKIKIFRVIKSFSFLQTRSKMWQDVIDLITDWIEEFRLFVLSYWSHFYLLRSELVNDIPPFNPSNLAKKVWNFVTEHGKCAAVFDFLPCSTLDNHQKTIFFGPTSPFVSGNIQWGSWNASTFDHSNVNIEWLYTNLVWFLQVILVVACIIIKIYVFNTKVKCSSKARLDGCTVLVTGANNGKCNKLNSLINLN